VPGWSFSGHACQLARGGPSKSRTEWPGGPPARLYVRAVALGVLVLERPHVSARARNNCGREINKRSKSKGPAHSSPLPIGHLGSGGHIPFQPVPAHCRRLMAMHNANVNAITPITIHYMPVIGYPLWSPFRPKKPRVD
jgi:hypothetical protein